MTANPMTKGRLLELLKDVPDSVLINVRNEDGEYTANIDFWFEDLETRKFVTLSGKESFWSSLVERYHKEERQ